MKVGSIFLSTVLLIGLLSLASAQNTYVLDYSMKFGLISKILSTEELKTVKSYSIQGWVKLSMTSPKTWPFDQMSQIGGSIFGVSNSQVGRLASDFKSDSVLSVSVKPLTQAEGFYAFYDSKKAMESLISPKPLVDLLGRWYFIYAAYHADLNQIYFAVKDSFYSTYSEKWSDKTIVRNPLNKTDLIFTVGAILRSNLDQSINGAVKDPTLKYLPSDIYYKSSKEIESSIQSNLPTQIGQINLASEQIQPASNANSNEVQWISGYSGSDQYSIYGNFQFTSLTSTAKDVLLYRVSTNLPTDKQTAYLEGDRALYAYLEKGTKLCFATYSFGLKGFNLNMTKCFTEITINNNPFSVYQAYNRKLQLVYNYVQIGGKEYFSTFESVLHMDPIHFYVYTGFDSMTQSVAGTKINNLAMDFGIGAYRAPLKLDSMSLKTYEKPQLYISNPSRSSSFKTAEIDSNSILNSQQFALHFWFRRDFTNSSSDQITQARTTVTNLLTITEDQNVISIGYSQQNSNIDIQIQNQKGSSTGFSLDYPMQQNEGQWMQFYFGYNGLTKEISTTLILQNGAPVLKTFVVSTPIGLSRFQVNFASAGKQMNTPGEFFDVQVVSHSGCFVDTLDSLQAYLKEYSQQSTQPPSRNPIKSRYEYLENTSLLNDDRPSGVIKVVSRDGTQIQDYQIEVWAMWNKSVKKTEEGSVLLSSSLHSQDQSYSITKLKDVVLQISMSTAGIVFTTYNFGQDPSTDNPKISKTIPLPDYPFDDQWCFYQFSYFQNTRSADGFVSCDNGFNGSVTFPNITHIVSSTIYFTAGNVPNSNQWYGSLFKPAFVVYGQGSNLDQNLNRPRPPVTPQCSTLFSQCGYVDEIAKICENKESFNLKEVKSVYVPKGQTIVFYKKANYKGIYVSFRDSVQCLNAGLTEDPSVQWSQMTALFHQGKVTFSNEKGIALSLHQAKIEFLGKGNQRKISHTQQKILQEDTEEAALA